MWVPEWHSTFAFFFYINAFLCNGVGVDGDSFDLYTSPLQKKLHIRSLHSHIIFIGASGPDQYTNTYWCQSNVNVNTADLVLNKDFIDWLIEKKKYRERCASSVDKFASLLTEGSFQFCTKIKVVMQFIFSLVKQTILSWKFTASPVWLWSWQSTVAGHHHFMSHIWSWVVVLLLLLFFFLLFILILHDSKNLTGIINLWYGQEWKFNVFTQNQTSSLENVKV